MSRTLDYNEVLSSYRRASSTGARRKVVSGCASALMAFAMITFMRGLSLMLALDILHDWLPAVPTMGFWAATALAFFYRAVILPAEKRESK